MRSPTPALEDRILRLGAGLSGLAFLAGAQLAWQEAQAHMALLGTICGAGIHPHCGWCYGAASLVLAGLAGFAYALRPNSNARLFQIKAEPSQI
ncbi:MAG: hypothetical protein AB1942_10700 [Pseudomonadota bacterium]